MVSVHGQGHHSSTHLELIDVSNWFPCFMLFSVPHLSALSLPRKQRNSGQPSHTLEFSWTHAASPSTPLSVLLQISWEKLSSSPFPKPPLGSCSLFLLSPQCDQYIPVTLQSPSGSCLLIATLPFHVSQVAVYFATAKYYPCIS